MAVDATQARVGAPITPEQMNFIRSQGLKQ